MIPDEKCRGTEIITIIQSFYKFVAVVNITAGPGDIQQVSGGADHDCIPGVV